MTKHKKLLWTLLGFLALTQTYQNCGGVRQFAAVGDQSAHESSVALPPEELEGLGSQSTVISESATPVATPTGTTTTANHSSTTPVNLPVFTYVVDYYLPFGSVSDSMKGPLNSAVGKVVRNSSCDSVSDSQYKCGEIPFGTIIDRNRKLVTTMNLGKTFQGKTGSKSYKFSSPDGKDIGLKVYMDRNQRAASQVLFYLPTQRTDAVSTGDKLGENIFFAITPRGHYLDTQVCAMVPGLKIELDDIELKGEARKSDALPFGIDAVAKGTITIRPGSLTFDQAFTCGTLRIVMVNGVPQVSLESFSGVKFQSSSYQGLRIEKHLKVSGVLGFFDDLFNLGVEDQFKKAIQSEVTKMVNKEVAINANEVKNGVYIAKYIDQAKLSPHLEKANEEIKKAFADNGYISALSDRVTQAACASAFGSMGLPPQAQIELTRLCSSPKIKVKSLYAAPNSHADCYKAFFDPRAGNSLGGTDWWKNSCKVIVRTEITMQKEVLPVIACLTESVKANSLPAQNCQAALVAMAEKYAQGDFAGAIANLKNVALTEQQIAEVKSLLTNQFKDASITAAQLKKIFQ